MAGEEELVLGREAMVAPSIAERVRERAAAMLDSGAAADGRGSPRAGAAEFAFDEDEASRRRVAMFLAVAAPLLFVAAIIASAALVGEPQARDESVQFAEAAFAPPADGSARAVAVSVAASAAPGAILAPENAQISTISLDGDRLAVHLSGGGSEEIVIYNIGSGAVVARLAVERSAAAAPSLQMIRQKTPAEPPAPSKKPAEIPAADPQSQG